MPKAAGSKRKRKNNLEDAYTPPADDSSSYQDNGNNGAIRRKRPRTRSAHRGVNYSQFHSLLPLIPLMDPPQQKAAERDASHPPISHHLTLQDYVATFPEQYLSDTILDYEMEKLKRKYLMHVSNGESDGSTASLRCRTFVMNCAESYILQHNTSRVAKRFFRGVELMKMDYILIPWHRVNHWTLVIVSLRGFLGSVGSNLDDVTENIAAKDSDEKNDSEKPTKAKSASRKKKSAIVICDSLSDNFVCGSIGKIVRNFLKERLLVEEKNNERSTADAEKDTLDYSPITLADLTAKELPVKHAKLPQQQNSYDCGVYLLKYLELMLIQIHNGKSPDSILTNSLRDIFTSDDITQIRTNMRLNYGKMRDAIGKYHPRVLQLCHELMRQEEGFEFVWWNEHIDDSVKEWSRKEELRTPSEISSPELETTEPSGATHPKVDPKLAAKKRHINNLITELRQELCRAGWAHSIEPIPESKQDSSDSKTEYHVDEDGVITLD